MASHEHRRRATGSEDLFEACLPFSRYFTWSSAFA